MLGQDLFDLYRRILVFFYVDTSHMSHTLLLKTIHDTESYWLLSKNYQNKQTYNDSYHGWD